MSRTMTAIPQAYLDRIRRAYPDLSLDRLEFIRDGLINDVVVVADERVCRFPKSEWGRTALQHEARVLEVVRRYVEVEVPHFEKLADDFVSYRFIPGIPLTRELLLRLPERDRTAVLTQVMEFVRALNSVPEAALDSASIGPSDTNRDRDWWLGLLDDVREHLFPHMWRHQHTFVENLFARVVSGELSFEYQPHLVSGDLAPYHLLFNPEAGRLGGVIDFGTVGRGDPAVDLCTLLSSYGESLVVPRLEAYPELRAYLDRARFWAATLELQWALRGVRDGDRGHTVAHLGGARDLLPVGHDSKLELDAAQRT